MKLEEILPKLRDGKKATCDLIDGYYFMMRFSNGFLQLCYREGDFKANGVQLDSALLNCETWEFFE